MNDNPVSRLGGKVVGFFNDKNRGFYRFHDDSQTHDDAAVKTPKCAETTELSTFANGNGKISQNGKGGQGSESECGYTGMLEVEEDTGETAKKKRNEITAWQAGWNVTNAIQVMTSRASHSP